MANQLQITGDTKVKSLNGVLTGTSGIVGSVPLGAANGVATLDSGGKVPVSQLPASVVTYLGTWNASTNTPTLANGTGDPGDMYICNVAGTVNFGAGPVAFVVGDWVLYGSGTWQKSSGQNGTVTSVGATITGSAIGITGSPITNAGTLAFAFAGTSGQYVNGAGNLTTFPDLSGYLPLTGGTLTGPLVGTSASFSGLLSANNQLTVGDGTTAANSSINFLGVFGVSYQWNLYNDANGFTIYSQAGVNALRLNASTGAATFSSSVTTGGNVGINTVTPQVSLSVVSTGDNYGIFIGPNAGSTTGQRLKIGYFGTSNYSAIQSINDGVTATSLVLQKDGGNVGIGTTNPNTIFSVVKAETLNAFTDYVQLSDNTNGLRISNYFDSGGIRWDFRRGTTSVISISQSNNVGIGTTTDAGYKLDVNGTGRFSGYIYGTGAANAYIMYNNSSHYNWLVGSQYNITNTFEITPSTAINGTTFSTPALQIAGNTGAATFSNNILVNDSFGLVNVASTSTGFFPTSSLTLLLKSNGSTALTIASSLAATFSSSVTASQFLATSSSNAAIITSTGVAGYGLVAVGSSGGARDILLAGQSGFSNGFTVQYTGTAMKYGFQDGNVLIGTSTDNGYKLNVNGSAYIKGTGNRPVSIDGNVNINADAGGWAMQHGFIGSSGTARGGFGAYGSIDTLSYYYVGIYGTEKLKIDYTTGASIFSSNVTSFNSGGTYFSAENGAGGYAKLEISSNATSNATLSFTNQLALTGGNVLIGTTTDNGSRLQVSGTYGNIAATFSGITTASQSFGVYINAGTNVNDYAFSVANAAENTNFFKIKGDGNTYISNNLGIGYVNPTEKLQVNGAIKTASPSSGTAAAWKLGTVVSGTCVPANFGDFAAWFTGNVIEIEINGSTYYVPAVIRNYC